MFIAMQNHPDFADRDLSSLRTGLMAGSPCPVEVMKRCVNDMHMAEVGIAYGMTETSPVSTQTRVDDDLERRTSTIGRVHPHVEIKVIDPLTGETVPRGTPGEFCTRGYSVMLGYWEQPDKTAESIDADGWMHTGDLAVMRDDGYCQHRRPDQGHGDPRRREHLPARDRGVPLHPSRHRGRPGDRRSGREVRRGDLRVDQDACRRRGPLDADAVRAFCDGRLAHYKIPRYVMIVDEFPMTVTGKIRKVEMREVAVEALGLS